MGEPSITKPTKFTTMQQRFIDFYDGNATEAAEKAGYTHPNVAGPRLLVNVSIIRAIRERENNRNQAKIMTRIERQEFWTKVINGEFTDQVVIGRGDDRGVVETETKMSDRLKASELLGRSEADFTDNTRVSDPDGKALTWKIEIVDPKDG